MRILLVALALFAGCGKGQLTLISCGSKLCDVSTTSVCCVDSTGASCTPDCTGHPRFNCTGPTTCPGGICCVDDLGGHCVQACNATQMPACEKSTDCASGVNCGTKQYVAGGAPVFSIGVCGAP